MRHDLFPEGFKAFSQGGIAHRHDDQSLLLKPQVCGFHEPELAGHDQGPNDHDHRDGKLNQHQGLPERTSTLATGSQPFQDDHRVEAGEAESRIHPGHKTNEEGDQQTCQDHLFHGQQSEIQGLAREIVESRQQHCNQQQGDQE